MEDTEPPARSSRLTLALSLLGLAGFLVLQGLLLRHFIRVDTRPPSWDQADHLEIALDYRQAIGAGRWGDFWYLAPKPGMPPFPPAYHLLLRGAYDSPDPARAALRYNWFYLAILAVSLFGLARRFLPDGRALAAALSFCAAPVVQELCTTQLLDLSVAAWAAAAYWALLAAEGFTLWPGSLAFGLLFATGMLHKWSFFSYFLPAALLGARALRTPSARWKALAAAALALALSGPWYWSHVLILPARLLQASADAAVPFWKPGAWAAYLVSACGDLGPLLWGLGLVGLLLPQRRPRFGDVWLLTAWIVTSYAFWTIVPNRQMRFLLPGLIPLGVAFAAAWPGWLVWGATAVQLAGAANFVFGWIGPLRLQTPLMPLTFLANRPPERENWRIPEILRRIEAERDPSRPLTNVTLVANDAYFNGPTFHWHERLLGLPHARLRGVNRRLCELSEFVLLKDGRLGPESVISGLPEAAAEIRRPGGWFQLAYEPAARWPLPDGSVAVLYRQRRSRPKPVAGRALTYAYTEAGGVKITDLRVSLGPWDAARSAWTNVRLAADRLEIKGLAVREAAAELEDFAFVPLYEGGRGDYDWKDLRLLRLKRVKVSGLRVDAADLKIFLEKRLPGLRLDEVRLDKTVRAAGRWRGRPVSAEAALELDPAARRLRVRVISARYADAPLPAALFRPIKELRLSLDPNPETPFFIDVPGLTIRDGRLTVP
ncbi:MAG: hypothetical protein HY552_05850 [Elusimicrobia bacterium]|nr:hypothetical protein [Elusimicrobiota bacterium]